MESSTSSLWLTGPKLLLDVVVVDEEDVNEGVEDTDEDLDVTVCKLLVLLVTLVVTELTELRVAMYPPVARIKMTTMVTAIMIVREIPPPPLEFGIEGRHLFAPF